MLYKLEIKENKVFIDNYKINLFCYILNQDKIDFLLAKGIVYLSKQFFSKKEKKKRKIFIHDLVESFKFVLLWNNIYKKKVGFDFDLKIEFYEKYCNISYEDV